MASSEFERKLVEHIEALEAENKRLRDDILNLHRALEARMSFARVRSFAPRKDGYVPITDKEQE
jgi:hypothetical protein